jgi:tetratricopeptide (TPR) repeat protein
MRASRSKPAVSACLIVRDEERVLARCLSTLRGACDEVCIVDTGSTDQTISIAKSFGARIERLTECNGPDGKIRDFAAARNASLEMAKGKYILCIDADELLADSSVTLVRAYAQRKDLAGVRVSMRWGSSRWLSIRLIRNHGSRHFVGNVHEHIVVNGRVENEPRIVIRNRPNKLGKEDSDERTVRIGSEILADNPDDMRALYYMGNALQGMGLWEEAIARYARYLALGGNFRCERHAAAQGIAICRLLRHEWALAVEACHLALKIDPRYAETQCVLGDAYGAQGQIDFAKHCFKVALAIRVPPPDGFLPINPAAYGSYPRKRLRECELLLKNQVDEAIQ